MTYPRIINLLAKFSSAKNGSALVEFSLLLPLLFTMMAGCFEFGRIMHQIHITNKGVTNAARYIARVKDPNLCNPSGTAVPTSVVTDARILAQKGKYGAGVNDPFIIPEWDSNSTFTVVPTCTPNPEVSGVSTFRGPTLITTITVSTSYEYEDIGMLGLLSLLPGSPTFAEDRLISATHSELYIGG